ncbi:MAG: GHKL domain-containing protein [Clostridia bacterium]|nr:GHKL domain-containing protein [Clostridia bacterium]
MIKKAQITFISITMSILLVVFVLLFGASVILISSVNDYHIDHILNDTANNYSKLGSNIEEPNCIVVLFTHNQETNSTEYTYTYDEEVFTKSDVEYIIEQAKAKPYDSGSIDSVRYKISTIDPVNREYLLVAYDTTQNHEVIMSKIYRSLIFLFIVYGALFYGAYRISFMLFQPIRETLSKQKQFISNASHELKTPLAVISANAEVLKDQQNAEWVKNIQSQTDRMNVLVNDMLTLAKMDEGKINLSKMEFNLSEEVINTALPFDAVAFEKGKSIELDVCPDIKLLGDLQSTKTIVSILLDNAIKHSAENSVIYLTLAKEGSKTVLTVKNDGSAVPDQDSKKVFERFYRADKSRSRESGGSGLGLSIAKSISDANKWHITANSRLNESMTIKVTF